MTSYERFKLWKSKFSHDEWRAYCRANYRKYSDKILASNKRSIERLDPEIRKQRVRAYTARYWAKNGDAERARRRKRYAADPKLRDYMRTWRTENQEYRRAYKQKNREKISEQTREWLQKNADRVSEKSRQWRLKNEQKIKEQNRQWRFNNPARRNKAEALRRARKRLVTVGDLAAVQQVYDRCIELRQWFKGLVVDHIVPLSKGGAHEASNLQIIYDFENARKNDRLNYKPRVIFA